MIAIALAACTVRDDHVRKAAAPVYPPHWGIYYNTGDGFMAVTGYFTPAQIRKQSLFKHLSTNRPVGCEGQTPLRYDVRWLDGPPPGEKRCAMVIYSFTCAPGSPRRGPSSLVYERKQALLDEVPHPVDIDCGQGKQQPSAPRENGDLLAMQELERKVTFPGTECAGDDAYLGKMRIRNATRFFIETRVSPDFPTRPFEQILEEPADILKRAATEERKVHVLTSATPLADDGANILITQSFAPIGADGYCITLRARQGDALWQRTIRRPHASTDASFSWYRHGPPDPEKWSPRGDQHFLAEYLAMSLGLKLPPTHQHIPDPPLR